MESSEDLAYYRAYIQDLTVVTSSTAPREIVHTPLESEGDLYYYRSYMGGT